MDDITTRAIIIGVNIFVTLTIVSLVIMAFFQMQEIYGIVRTTDTSIYNRFDDVYSTYNGKVVSGIGLLNALKKHEEQVDKTIVITYTNSSTVRTQLERINANKEESEIQREASYLKSLMEQGKDYNYEDTYNATVYYTEDNNIVINFERVIKISK